MSAEVAVYTTNLPAGLGPGGAVPQVELQQHAANATAKRGGAHSTDIADVTFLLSLRNQVVDVQPLLFCVQALRPFALGARHLTSLVVVLRTKLLPNEGYPEVWTMCGMILQPAVCRTGSTLNPDQARLSAVSTLYWHCVPMHG